jgi:hypothetical protein
MFFSWLQHSGQVKKRTNKQKHQQKKQTNNQTNNYLKLKTVEVYMYLLIYHTVEYENKIMQFYKNIIHITHITDTLGAILQKYFICLKTFSFH